MKRTMRTLSRPTGPREVLTMLATAPHAITAINQIKQGQGGQQTGARLDGHEGSQISTEARRRRADWRVTVLSADVLAGLALAEDVDGLGCVCHGGGEVGGSVDCVGGCTSARDVGGFALAAAARC
jgi:hypothetical protein